MVAYSTLSDQELTSLLRQGDRMAYTEIYHRYKFILHNHAWNKTRNREEAQDVIQEIFAMLWAKREGLDVGTNLAGYLYRSLRNYILNQIVRKDVQNKYIASIKDFVDRDPVIADHLVREHQLSSLIEKEIQALPPRMREVFELSRKENLSHKQIAERLGTTEQTVKKQMTNTLKILKTKLGLMVYLMYIFRF
ncbi:RNA polymerase sigma-70 factor (family 1) [Pedobacter africanus]|uniref:RNA polymerase sigma-70 factor (ECF subfamily) n=1 Tax=Pedobacter africanus TaxID=151894 RepID=A0ACC6L386_9SPHI|nr:RNA polymerase sigma-70 factor [Pedobacter africanus]MDR6786118.1 RNA polymerase sigma-70 factor (ECF subfamily) [Pedobacter africanus]